MKNNRRDQQANRAAHGSECVRGGSTSGVAPRPLSTIELYRIYRSNSASCPNWAAFAAAINDDEILVRLICMLGSDSHGELGLQAARETGDLELLRMTARQIVDDWTHGVPAAVAFMGAYPPRKSRRRARQAPRHELRIVAGGNTGRVRSTGPRATA